MMRVSRRSVLKLGASGLTMATLGALGSTWVPTRLAHPAPSSLPSIQFDIGDYIGPVEAINGIDFRFGPVFTSFITARLKRRPDEEDQQVLNDALAMIENRFAFSPEGVFTFISYGLPYFRRLPRPLVAQHMLRLTATPNRFALEEAVPSPTDVSRTNRQIEKVRFNVPVAIERNDVLVTLRSDTLAPLLDVYSWLKGVDWLNGQFVPAPAFRGLFESTSSRLMFAQRGLPRKVAEAHSLPYAGHVPPDSPMWMGFADQHVTGAGPASIVAFQGNEEARFTDTKAGDYFFDGAIQHLSHLILDLAEWYDETYSERVQYMFRSNPIPSIGKADQFVDGGGPTFLAANFQGREDALHNATAADTFEGKRRMGHLAALHRSSRTSKGTPLHIRMDGPGFDTMDVPDGSTQPKLHFTVFVPTANFFAAMRRNQAATDLVERHGVEEEDNGLERFLTVTRRQNFLVPPRIHRAFPLVELT